MAFTHIGRFIFWNFADINDLHRFPSVTVSAEPDGFHFRETTGQAPLKIPEIVTGEPSYHSFDDFLERNSTVAFLLIKNDTILYEIYFGSFDTASLLPGFSMAKSVVSALTGIALGEGAIKNVNQPVTDYLQGWKHEGFENITIEHLLNMRSGIRFSESYYNPLGEIALFYYGKNLRRYTFRSRIEEPPGLQYNYISVNTQILAYILEAATGTPLPEYLEQKIWKPIGAEYDATWNIDSRKHGSVKAFCCLNATARDFARIGRLYLNKGEWNGRQIIPEPYVRKTMSVINESLDSEGYPYTYMWRVLESGEIFAKGILGQYLFVDPKSGIIALRFGTGSADMDWIDVFRDIAGQLD